MSDQPIMPNEPADAPPTLPPQDVTSMSPQQLAEYAATQTPYELGEDTTCLACEYNLRGLQSDGRCPECGTSIGRSLYGNFLKFADPEYVGRLAKGVSLILWGILASIVTSFAGTFLIAATGTAIFGQLLILAGSLVSVAGTWLLTSPDPSKLDEAWQMSARKFIRVVVVLAVGKGLLDIITGTTTIGGKTATAILILNLLFAVIQLTSWVATFIYFRQLALRIPDLALAKRTRVCMWGLSICFGANLLLISLSFAATAASGAAPSAIGTTVGTFLGCFGGVGMLIFGLLWLITLFKYRRLFKEQAQAATNTWASLAGVGVPMPSPAD